MAVLAVVLFHANAALVPGGFAGVDVFFVISGFLITALLLEGLAQGSFSATAFYARRIRRLAPSLIVVLAAAWAAGWAWLPTPELAQLGTHIASSAAFITNVVLWRESGYFDAAAEQKPLLHLWSLGVEEQFYLIWPAFLALTWTRVRPLTMVLGVAVASFAVNVATIGSSPSAAFYWPTSRFWELAIGAAIACLSLSRGGDPRLAVPNSLAWLRLPTTRRTQNGCAVIGLLLLALGLAVLHGGAAFPGWWALLPAGGTGLLIAAGPQAWINRTILAQQGLVFIGLISYPLYLWHWPLFTFARILAVEPLGAETTAALVAAAGLLAWLSYRLLERPLRHARSRLVVPALVAAMTVAAALGLVVRANQSLLPERFPPEVRALVQFTYRYEELYRERVCYLMPDQPPGALAPECIQTTPADRPLVFLWGDSHAAHLYPGLEHLQSTVPFRLAEVTGSRCPPLLDIETPTQPYCQDANRVVLDRIRDLRPATVLLAARWRLYDLSFLERTIAAARTATAARLVVLGPVPTWYTRLPSVLFALSRQHPLQGVPMRTSFGLESYVWELEREVRARVEQSGAEYVSAMDALCNRDGCLTRVTDQPDNLTAWDETHLTAAGSEYLIDQIADRILPPSR